MWVTCVHKFYCTKYTVQCFHHAEFGELYLAQFVKCIYSINLFTSFFQGYKMLQNDLHLILTSTKLRQCHRELKLENSLMEKLQYSGYP